MSYRMITFNQAGLYFDPPLHPETVENWLRICRVKVFRSPQLRGKKKTNAIRCIRQVSWEKLIRDNEKRIEGKRVK